MNKFFLLCSQAEYFEIAIYIKLNNFLYLAIFLLTPGHSMVLTEFMFEMSGLLERQTCNFDYKKNIVCTRRCFVQIYLI